MQGLPEKECQGLKELVDGDFGLLELVTNTGRDVKKKNGNVYYPQYL